MSAVWAARWHNHLLSAAIASRRRSKPVALARPWSASPGSPRRYAPRDDGEKGCVPRLLPSAVQAADDGQIVRPHRLEQAVADAEVDDEEIAVELEAPRIRPNRGAISDQPQVTTLATHL